MATVFQIPSADQCVILDTRQMLVYPFTCPNWIELRIGVYLSLTSSTNNNLVTGLGETITTTGTPLQDNYFVGLKTNNSNLPCAPSEQFIGWSSYNSSGGGNLPLGTYQPTSGNYYWQPTSGITIAMWPGSSGGSVLASASLNGFWLPQNVGGISNGTLANGMVLRIHRTGSSSTVLDSNTSSNCNFIVSSTPTVAEIRGWMRNLPAMQPWWVGTKDITAIPTAFCVYWPFFNSKLRLHNVVIEKFA